MASHSQAKVSKSVPQKRCRRSTVSRLLGKSVIQESLIEIVNVSQKVAKGPKVTLSFKRCCLTWNSRQKLLPSLRQGEMVGKGVGGGLSLLLVLSCI